MNKLVSPDYLFVGDSITDAGRDRGDAASLGNGYVSFLAEALTPATVRNAGVAGDRAIDVASRWERDVAPFSPRVLTLFVGINDTWRRFDSGQATSADRFGATCRSLLEAFAARKDPPALVVMEPFLLPVRAEQQQWLDDLAEKRAALRRAARDLGAIFVPLHGLLTTAAQEAGATALTADGVHPTAAGSTAIADEWMRAVTKEIQPSAH